METRRNFRPWNDSCHRRTRTWDTDQCSRASASSVSLPCPRVPLAILSDHLLRKAPARCCPPRPALVGPLTTEKTKMPGITRKS